MQEQTGMDTRASEAGTPVRADTQQSARLVPALIAATLVIYHSTVADLWHLWTAKGNSLYSHGLVLLGIAAYISWRQWRRYITEAGEPSIITGNLLLAGTSITWFLARLGHVQLLQELCLLGVVIFLMWSLAGPLMAKRIVWSVLLLVCAVPIWEFATGILQAATVLITTQLLNATNISAVAEGTRILIREGTFVVDNGCTGLGQHQTAVALALLYGYWSQARVPAVLVYVAIAVLTAFISNTIRIYTIVVAGHLTEMQHSLIKDHVWLGWVVFTLAVFLIMSAAGKWHRRVW